RNATRCEHRQRFATMSRADETKSRRLQFTNENKILSGRLGGLFRFGRVEILARYAYRAAVFSLPKRKIPATKLLQFVRTAL
ncbi:MAG TPA: hypothetical protein PKE65_04290, partial [Rhizobiaceae bacterium]|nr:hypothetical protein [Rhizobiaceae bacterium]